MSPPIEDIVDAEPPTIDPYEVLGLERDATAEQVKSAYRKAALKNHPGTITISFPFFFHSSKFLAHSRDSHPVTCHRKY